MTVLTLATNETERSLPGATDRTFTRVLRGHAQNVIKRHREASRDLKTSSLDKMAAKNGDSCKHGLVFPRRFVVAQPSKFVWIIQSFC